MDIRTRRIYDRPGQDEGLRILVDRLWPRGISKEEAALDHWAKDLAPSDDLRRWYHAHPDAWEAFRERYFAELDQGGERVGELIARIGGRRATLLYGSRQTECNNATALKEFLERYAAD